MPKLPGSNPAKDVTDLLATIRTKPDDVGFRIRNTTTKVLQKMLGNIDGRAAHLLRGVTERAVRKGAAVIVGVPAKRKGAK